MCSVNIMVASAYMLFLFVSGLFSWHLKCDRDSGDLDDILRHLRQNIQLNLDTETSEYSCNDSKGHLKINSSFMCKSHAICTTYLFVVYKVAILKHAAGET